MSLNKLRASYSGGGNVGNGGNKPVIVFIVHIAKCYPPFVIL